MLIYTPPRSVSTSGSVSAAPQRDRGIPRLGEASLSHLIADEATQETNHPSNRALGCDFFEGVVIKRADSPYLMCQPSRKRRSRVCARRICLSQWPNREPSSWQILTTNRRPVAQSHHRRGECRFLYPRAGQLEAKSITSTQPPANARAASQADTCSLRGILDAIFPPVSALC